ncbi:unnamed protein product [Danaus chrysippus]|uniref:(African queen) hypothetical protein n=1 Tax=Danaus chrysippus TaxID=151541 RepID=A0A8J2QL78_9NEOP|nr:unnamed protein product [Danaus chrysippus]
MHLSIYILASVFYLTTAHYRGYESRNLIVREEPFDLEGLVECPVCQYQVSWLPTREVCNITIGNKKYKRCRMGNYTNTVCGNRLDCFRGPGEQCTESMENDYYGQKCARGYDCDGTFHVCTGYGYTINSHMRWLLNHVSRYPGNQNDDQLREKALYLA